MPRTIVYPSSRNQTPAPAASTESQGDSFPEKLVKYVPAEALAFYIPALSLAGDNVAYLVTIFIVGLVGTIIYLLVAAQKQQTQKPEWYFYLLAALAYIAWALSVSPKLAIWIGLGETAARIILAIAVFLTPGLDSLFTKPSTSQVAERRLNVAKTPNSRR